MSSIEIWPRGHAYGEPRRAFGPIPVPATLAAIAKAYYGEPGRWRAIARANGMDWQGNRPLTEYLDEHNGGRPAVLRVPDLEGR